MLRVHSYDARGPGPSPGPLDAMNRKLALLLLFLASSLLPACSRGPSDPTADEGSTQEQLLEKAKKIGADALRVTVDTYEKAIAELERARAQAMEKMKTLSPGEILGQVGSELKAQIDAAGKQINALRAKLQVYVDELGKRGAGG